MTPNRQLAAIMFTDIVGYSSLMGSDEYKAMQLLRVNRKIHKAIINKRNGKWLKEMGDGTLASFKTISDAVYCAGELIKRCQEESIGLKIGIHEGEIIEENGDIFGDGVNVASRLESIAEPGQILVSGTVNRNIKNKEGIESIFLKELLLKNIDDPIRVYRLEIDDLDKNKITNHSSDTRTWKKPIFIFLGLIILVFVVFVISLFSGLDYNQEVSKLEKSIAVLPFKSFSSDENHLAFCDGQWEAVSSNLSRISGLRVISTQSTEVYRDSNKSTKQIADEINVNFLIRGTIQKYENSTKISVQLLNANTGEQLWVKEFTREITNIFQLQSDVAEQIADELKIQLTESENKYLSNNIEILPEDYEMYLSGLKYYESYFDNYDTISFNNAKNRFKHVIQVEPNLSDAYVYMGWLHRYINKDSCFIYLKKAIENDNLNYKAHLYLAYYFSDIQRDDDKFYDELKLAYDINPNDNEINSALWIYYSEKRKFDLAVFHLIKSIKVNPNISTLRLNDRVRFYNNLTVLFLCIGDFDAAFKLQNKLKEINPNYAPSTLAHLFTWQGKHKDALPYYFEQYKKDTCDFIRIHWLAEGYSYINNFDSADFYYKKCLLYKDMFPYEFPPIYNRYGFVLFKLGRFDESEKMFEIHKKLATSNEYYSGNIFDLAGNYAFHGEFEKSIELLNRLDFWYIHYLYVMVDPMFDGIRDNPEFVKLLHSFKKEQLTIKEIVNQKQIRGELERFYSL